MNKDKRGQVTVFIIIAIIIVALGVLIYFFFPGIRSVTNLETKSPYAYFQECLNDKFVETIDRVSLQGGSIHPDFYYESQGEILEYLCYTNKYYELCSVQQPMLLSHMQNEIEAEIKEDAQSCFESMDESYKNKGYQTNLKKGNNFILVEILPKKVVVNFDVEFSIAKEETQTYKSFNIILNRDLYQLVSVANSIVTWEARYGDAETANYMNLYQNLKVEKDKQVDGTTIYAIEDRKSGDKFQFASRSLVFAPGYVVEQ